MKAAIKAAALALLLILSGVESELGSTCSKNRKCPNSKTCCSVVCVAVRKVCKFRCREPADCDSSRSETCDDGFCKCLSRSSCANDSIWDEFGMSKPCQVDADCIARLNAQCLNQTCENSSVISTNDAKPEELPLNPALLAIVTIMGVLIFSFLFCCCLSRMKSERKSMKSREAKGKLKSLGIEPRTIGVGTENSSPLIKAESQGAPSKNSTLASENSRNTSPRDRDEEMLISVVIENGLPPIREEDEEDEEDEKD